jgi:hypothetical protein
MLDGIMAKTVDQPIVEQLTAVDLQQAIRFQQQRRPRTCTPQRPHTVDTVKKKRDKKPSS